MHFDYYITLYIIISYIILCYILCHTLHVLFYLYHLFKGSQRVITNQIVDYHV